MLKGFNEMMNVLREDYGSEQKETNTNENELKVNEIEQLQKTDELNEIVAEESMLDVSIPIDYTEDLGNNNLSVDPNIMDNTTTTNSVSDSIDGIQDDSQVKTKEVVREVVRYIEKPVPYLDCDKCPKLEEIEKQTDKNEKTNYTGSLFSSFFLQISLMVIILLIVKSFVGSTLTLNNDLVRSTYKGSMKLDGNTLVICDDTYSFVNDAIKSITDYNYQETYVNLGIVCGVMVIGLYVSYRAFRSANKVARIIQRLMLCIVMGFSITVVVISVKDNFAFMTEENLYTYFDSLSSSELDDLAMTSSGVKLQIRSDGTVHGVYKADKENMLDTLIDGSASWGIDFELPKELRVLDAKFILKDVNETEFIYELPEVFYIEDYIDSEPPIVEGSEEYTDNEVPTVEGSEEYYDNEILTVETSEEYVDESPAVESIEELDEDLGN